MTGLPRKYAKMGFARGWRAFKASKRTAPTRKISHSSPKRTEGAKTMARRRIKKSRRSSGFGGVGTSLTSVAVQAGGAYLYDAFVEPMIPVSNPTAKNAIGVGVGLMLASKGPGMLKNAGKGIATINAYQLIAGLMSGTSVGSSSSSGTNQW